ncbi:TPA: NAD(P)/FAD-dependent oxidoreductase [Bacillus tropicus]|uniref:NAD(P)/FAD-dependent oxidoreductase n=1 Tax=Bacillus cereus group TaxID=86661 RepID=UPI00003CB5C2|nr:MULTISPECIES: FAD-dependent oxidoreductase [Bacillus cereus group]AIY72951.1 FAD binding domain protein [Bacillus cereus]AJI08028.1 FAD binding domain protein [Bacillus cereus G9241]EAL15965.1 probable electron transfer protein Rv1937, putative [Bacillus cereus G9241]QPS53449.1 glutamate synthase [Bacillus tropicus]
MLKRAIVIGNSIAGLLASKALSEHFQEVIILEKRGERHEKTTQQAVPQSYHPHVLLKRGEQEIKKLFPQIFDELIENGSVVNDFTANLKWYHFGFWKQPFLGGIQLIQQSRTMLEVHLQKSVNQLSNVNIKYGVKVKKLLMEKKKNKIYGVTVKCNTTKTTREIHADLVIDASGYGSNNISWLKDYGIEVKEEKVEIKLFYATRLFCIEKENRPDWCNLLISPSLPENPFGAYIQSIEDNVFSVTFSGYTNVDAPKTNEEFLAYAKKLFVPDVGHFLEKASPITDLKVYKISDQVYRRFDQVKGIPEGFVVIGDAHCRFDPMFGQGISVAAMQATELSEFLQRTTHISNNFSVNFHRKIANYIATPWDMATTEALRHPGIKGRRPLILPIKQWYIKKIYQQAAVDSNIYMRLVKVMNLIESPITLFYPDVILSLLKNKKSRNKEKL